MPKASLAAESKEKGKKKGKSAPSKPKRAAVLPDRTRNWIQRKFDKIFRHIDENMSPRDILRERKKFDEREEAMRDPDTYEANFIKYQHRNEKQEKESAAIDAVQSGNVLGALSKAPIFLLGYVTGLNSTKNRTSTAKYIDPAEGEDYYAEQNIEENTMKQGFNPFMNLEDSNDLDLLNQSEENNSKEWKAELISQRAEVRGAMVQHVTDMSFKIHMYDPDAKIQDIGGTAEDWGERIQDSVGKKASLREFEQDPQSWVAEQYIDINDISALRDESKFKEKEPTQKGGARSGGISIGGYRQSPPKGKPSPPSKPMPPIPSKPLPPIPGSKPLPPIPGQSNPTSVENMSAAQKAALLAEAAAGEPATVSGKILAPVAPLSAEQIATMEQKAKSGTASSDSGQRPDADAVASSAAAAEKRKKRREQAARDEKSIDYSKVQNSFQLVTNVPTESFDVTQKERSSGKNRFKATPGDTEEETRKKKSEHFTAVFKRQIKQGEQYKVLKKRREVSLGTAFKEDEDPVLKGYIEDQRYHSISRTQQGAAILGTGGSSGHIFIRLKQHYRGKLLTQYSFGFCTTMIGSTAHDAAQTGLVLNPDEKSSEGDIGENAVLKEETISQSALFNTVGYIRSVIGSARTYSLTGYNCSSFGAEAAHAAGVDVGNSFTKMMSTKSLKDKIDTPHALAKSSGFFERTAEEIEQEQGATLGDMFMKIKADKRLSSVTALLKQELIAEAENHNMEVTEEQVAAYINKWHDNLYVKLLILNPQISPTALRMAMTSQKTLDYMVSSADQGVLARAAFAETGLNKILVDKPPEIVAAANKAPEIVAAVNKPPENAPAVKPAEKENINRRCERAIQNAKSGDNVLVEYWAKAMQAFTKDEDLAAMKSEFLKIAQHCSTRVIRVKDDVDKLQLVQAILNLLLILDGENAEFSKEGCIGGDGMILAIAHLNLGSIAREYFEEESGVAECLEYRPDGEPEQPKELEMDPPQSVQEIWDGIGVDNIKKAEEIFGPMMPDDVNGQVKTLLDFLYNISRGFDGLRQNPDGISLSYDLCVAIIGGYLAAGEKFRDEDLKDADSLSRAIVEDIGEEGLESFIKVYPHATEFIITDFLEPPQEDEENISEADANQLAEVAAEAEQEAEQDEEQGEENAEEAREQADIEEEREEKTPEEIEEEKTLEERWEGRDVSKEMQPMLAEELYAAYMNLAGIDPENISKIDEADFADFESAFEIFNVKDAYETLGMLGSAKLFFKIIEVYSRTGSKPLIQTIKNDLNDCGIEDAAEYCVKYDGGVRAKKLLQEALNG